MRSLTMKHMAIILISILILPFLTQAAEITDGLILYMPLDEGSGNTTEDKSKTKAEGEVKGAKWVDGKFGKVEIPQEAFIGVLKINKE